MKTHDVDGYPTRCASCGEPVLKTKQAIRYETVVATGAKAAWHAYCPRKESSK